MAKILQQGAEAVISLENNQILKNRIRKSYRIEELDNKLRKLRTRSEGKIISKLIGTIPVPKIIDINDFEMKIKMEFIDGKRLSDNLENLDWKKICKQIGETIAKLHDANIIHGDLTTSNMIYVEKEDAFKTYINPLLKNNLIINKKRITSEQPSTEAERVCETNKDELRAGSRIVEKKYLKAGEQSEPEGKVYFIDFGLSFYSKKIEDKAVDLHLLKQAFEAKHFKIAEQAIKIILENYNSLQKKETIERLRIVENRGRYKERN